VTAVEDLTPGQMALREAARLEQARIYSQVQREHRAKDDPPVRLATIHPLRRRTA
jgi:hypothetical protein